jgi:hypothetical protein
MELYAESTPLPLDKMGVDNDPRGGTLSEN